MATGIEKGDQILVGQYICLVKSSLTELNTVSKDHKQWKELSAGAQSVTGGDNE